MAANIAIGLDATDEAILLALQTNGRQSIADLARTINMSHSGTAERVRRLEESGVLAGYSAVVSAERLGYSIMAFLRLRYPSSHYEPLHKLLAELPQVVEAHHVTGEDCFIMKVMATSMQDLERTSGQVGTLGGVTTSVVYSTPLPPRPLLPPAPAPGTRHPADSGRLSTATGPAA
jgi:Lrp/AsnC family transcriptional regulator, leucine-responsive regulatory protein